MHTGNRLAAVDLGSNSFRLEIGRVEHGEFRRTLPQTAFEYCSVQTPTS